MYSKDDLSSRNVATLKDIAKEIGAKIKSSDNKETIIYAILMPRLSKLRNLPRESVSAFPRKRTRYIPSKVRMARIMT